MTDIHAADTPEPAELDPDPGRFNGGAVARFLRGGEAVATGPLDVALLAEAIAVVDLALPPGNDRERTYWRTNADQLQQARAIAAEYARLAETPREDGT